MFSFIRTPIASPSTKQALMASFPFPTTTTTNQPVDSTTPRRPRRFTGALFMGTPTRPSSPRIIQGMRAASETQSPLLRQAMSPRETAFTPPSPTFAVAPSSPRMPVKSCLKSPAGPKSPVANIHSPRFASIGLMSIKSREGPLWGDEGSLTKSPRFASSAIMPVRSGEGPLWVDRGKTKTGPTQDRGSGYDDEVEWKKCRTRIPTPFQSPRAEWLGSE